MRLFPCLTLLAASALAIQAAEPEWKKNLSPARIGPHQALPAGILELDITWKGMVRSGLITMDFGKDGEHKPNTRVVRTTAISMGAATAVFPYRGNSWAELNSSSLQPKLIEAWEKGNQETTTTTSSFQNNRVTSKEVTRTKGKRKEQVEEQTFLHTPTYDISSALLHIRSQKLQKGDELSLMLHPFKSPYLLKAKVLNREKHLDRDCIAISLEMFKIDRTSLELRPYKKLKGPATLWLSDDDLRIPVEVRANVFIGDIRATLAGFKKA